MSPQAEATASLKTQARRIIAELKRSVAAGETHWFFALMQAVREWPLAQEQVGEREYRYLVGGEAFDWLLLAERLCDEIEGLIPDEEREALLFRNRLPEEVDENDVERLLGAKHRAHLNYVYGVRVEEALQLAVADEVHKERYASRLWENGHGDDEVCHRLYGATRRELFAEFREASNKSAPKKTANRARSDGSKERVVNGSHAEDNGQGIGEEVSLADLTEFTYWLFRRRVTGSEPARVASDTRKGVAMLQRLEALHKHASTAAN
jgi:hypothetical protein